MKIMRPLIRMAALLAFVMAAFTAQAQTSFSCTERAICLLDDDLEIVDCINREEPSLFVINDAETMITHTVESGKNTYYVHDREYDSDNGTFTYRVTSDTGDDFLFDIDPNEKTIHVFYTDEDDDLWVERFKVKAIF